MYIYLNVCEQMSSGFLKNVSKIFTNHIYLVDVYKKDLALNNRQWLICYKTKPNQTKPNHIYLIYMYKEDLALNNLQWLICHKTQPNQIIYI